MEDIKMSGIKNRPMRYYFYIIEFNNGASYWDIKDVICISDLTELVQGVEDDFDSSNNPRVIEAQEISEYEFDVMRRYL
jgi:hypothetical protein